MRNARIGRCAVLVLAALLLGIGAARADTFRWKDGRVARGRVLAEFKDVYFAQLETDAARFVDARELESVLDADDHPIEMGKVKAPAPLLAVDGVVSDVRLQRKAGGAPETLGEEPAFAYDGDRISTGDSGLARIAFPSTGVARLGASTVVVARAGDNVESLLLEQGELFVAPEAAGLDVALANELKVRARDGVFEVARVPGAALWRVTAHRGKARVEGETFRIEVAPSLTAHVERLRGGFQVTAEVANPLPLEMAVGAEVRVLAPGETFFVSNAARTTAAVGGTWKLTRVVGTVRVRRAPVQGDEEPVFRVVSALDATHVLLEPGDAVATGSASEALLVREDNAQLTLGETSELELAGLLLRAGVAKVEALKEPVPFLTPSGEADLSFVAAELRRPRARDERLLEVYVETGEARLPLPAAGLAVSASSRVSIEGTGEEARVHGLSGKSTVSSVARGDSPDVSVSLALMQGGEVGVRSLHKDGVAFLLEGDREVGFGPEKVSAKVSLGTDVALKEGGERPKVVFEHGAETELEKGLHIRFGFERGAPLARFKGGERILLADAKLRVRVENPKIVFPDETWAAFKDAVSATLSTGEGLAGAVVGARKEDRLEISPKTGAVVGRRRYLDAQYTSFELEDRRRLWIDDGAPPVQSRMAPRRAQALTMPQTAPLTIDAARKVTVLATREGEFVIIDDPAILEAEQGLEGLRPLSAPTTSLVIEPNPDHLPELLNEPPPASQTTPP